MHSIYIHNTQESVNRWLSGLGGGQGSLKLNQQGNCFMVAENEIGLVVSCTDRSRQVAILAQLNSVPISLNSHLYEEILALNLNLEFNMGTQIFFDKNTRMLGLLVARDIISLDEISFYNLLNNFKDKALETREFIEAILHGDATHFVSAQYNDSSMRSFEADGRLRGGV